MQHPVSGNVDCCRVERKFQPHSRVAVADLIFCTIGTHLLEANQQEELNSIGEQLEQLENGGLDLDVSVVRRTS